MVHSRRQKGDDRYGKLADLTILSKDIMRVPAMDVLSTQVEMTIVDGKVVYRKLPRARLNDEAPAFYTRPDSRPGEGDVEDGGADHPSSERRVQGNPRPGQRKSQVPVPDLATSSYADLLGYRGMERCS